MPSGWVNERKRDYYYRKAKTEKFRSRASYKLFQAVKKYNFIKPGYIVVDLGATPGGWTQAALHLVGDSGFVLSVDRKPLASFKEPNVSFMIGDIREKGTIQNIRNNLSNPADVVISDVSPNISGIWELDHARQIDLARKSLDISKSILRTGGNFFVKVFQGSLINEVVNETKKNFNFVKLFKPKASRSKSAEIYLVGLNLIKKVK